MFQVIDENNKVHQAYGTFLDGMRDIQFILVDKDGEFYKTSSLDKHHYQLYQNRPYKHKPKAGKKHDINSKKNLVPTYTAACYGGEYEYSKIIDYDRCCLCEHFSDNKYEERFECMKTDREVGEDCFKTNEYLYEMCIHGLD